MTLEEKVGQMTQINFTVIAKGPNRFSSSTPMEIDDNRANKALVEYKVGSVLNTINNTAQKPSVWFKNISKIQEISMNNNRLKIPVIYGIDLYFSLELYIFPLFPKITFSLKYLASSLSYPSPFLFGALPDILTNQKMFNLNNNLYLID